MKRNIVKKSVSVFIVFVMLLGFNAVCPQEASAGMEPFIGEIEMFAGNYAPKDWMLCQGQLLSTQQYQALYAVLGTTYGGNGTTNFALPDLRGRVPIGFGKGPVLQNIYIQGAIGGAEYVTLNATQLPVQGNGLQAVTATGITSTPAANVYPARVTSTVTAPDRQEITVNTNSYAPLSGTTVVLGATSTGGGQSHENMQPYLT